MGKLCKKMQEKVETRGLVSRCTRPDMHPGALNEVLIALQRQTATLENQITCYCDSIRSISADINSGRHRSDASGSPQPAELSKLERAIQQERATLTQLQSDMDQHQKSVDEQYSSIMQGKEAQRHKCLALDHSLTQLRAQLSHKSSCNIEIQINRDAAKSQLAANQLEREAWRVQAIDRVQQLELRHVELTASRGELEACSRTLQQNLQQSHKAKEQAEGGGDKARGMLEKTLVLNQQLVAKLKRLKDTE